MRCAASAELRGEAPDFGGDDREPVAVLAGARRFQRGVQSEKLGLTRDLLNEDEECLDLVRRRRQSVDSFGALERIGCELLKRAGRALEANTIVARQLAQRLVAPQPLFGSFTESSR